MNIEKEELKKWIIEAIGESEVLDVNSREWWNLKDACDRKGLCYKTACNRKELQPNGGIPDGKIGGRKVWRWKTIEKWIEETDDMLVSNK